MTKPCCSSHGRVSLWLPSLSSEGAWRIAFPWMSIASTRRCPRDSGTLKVWSPKAEPHQDGRPRFEFTDDQKEIRATPKSRTVANGRTGPSGAPAAAASDSSQEGLPISTDLGQTLGAWQEGTSLCVGSRVDLFCVTSGPVLCLGEEPAPMVACSFYSA